MRNLAKCNKCGDIIESKSRHDFQMCSCGSIFVDGGTDYIRRGGDPEDFDEEYDRLHGISQSGQPTSDPTNEDDEQERALTEKAREIDRKYGSSMLKALVLLDGNEPLMDIYVDFVKCRHRAHKLIVASRVCWVLALACMIASFFILPLYYTGTFIMFFGIYAELTADSYSEHALHNKNVIIINVINSQVQDIADEVEKLSKKGKRNVGRTRKTQRKKA